MIGGIVAALATIYLLPPTGDLPVVRSQVADQAATVEQIQTRLEALEGTDAATRERLAALETTAEATPKPDAVAAQIAEAEARLTALEDKVGKLGAGGADEAGGQHLAALEDELASLSATVAGLQKSGAGAAGATSSGQIAALEQRLDRVAQAADQVAELSGRLGALSDEVASSRKRTEDVARDVAALGGQIKLLDQRAQALGGEVATLQTRVATTEEQVATASDRQGRAATLALLVGQLETAIDQARPYEGSLESLRALGAEDDVVKAAAAELEPTAATGVPSLEQLRQAFAPAANEIVQAAQAPEGDSMLDRAAGNLMRLVTVRPVGADAEGNDAAARVARAEAKLGDSDLAGTAAELEGLEGRAAEAAAPWLGQAHARLAATNALDRLQTHTAGLLAQAR